MKLTTTIREAVAISGLSKSGLYNLINRGALDTVTVGRRRLVKVESLNKLLEVA